MGDEGVVVDGIFLVGLGVGDDRCQRGFATCSGCGGDGYQQGQAVQHFEHALHRSYRFPWPGHTGAYPLGAVDGRAAAEGDDGLASVGVVEFKGVLNIADGGIRYGFIIDHMGYALLGERCQQRFHQP